MLSLPDPTKPGRMGWRGGSGISAALPQFCHCSCDQCMCASVQRLRPPGLLCWQCWPRGSPGEMVAAFLAKNCGALSLLLLDMLLCHHSCQEPLPGLSQHVGQRPPLCTRKKPARVKSACRSQASLVQQHREKKDC